MRSDQTPLSSMHPSPIDAIAHDLQQLRVETGQLSYSQIAVLISQKRQLQGATPAAAYVAKSTVYDVFRAGRKRINIDLVCEIASVLGEDPSSISQWRNRSVAASMPTDTVVSLREPETSLKIPVLVDQQRALTLAILSICVGLNIFGNTVTEKFGLPLFLDMTGTAIAAFVAGPWSGAAVAIATGVLTSLSGSPQSLLFSVVGVGGAIVWGVGYHRLKMGQTKLRFLALNLSAALICAILATPLTALIYHGSVTHASTFTSSAIFGLGQAMWAAIFFGNLLSSVADKMVSGYLARLLVKNFRWSSQGIAARGAAEQIVMFREKRSVAPKQRITQSEKVAGLSDAPPEGATRSADPSRVG